VFREYSEGSPPIDGERDPKSPPFDGGSWPTCRATRSVYTLLDRTKIW